MTTIKDLLRDFQADTIQLTHEFIENNNEQSQDEIENHEEKLEQLIDDLVQTIKERYIG